MSAEILMVNLRKRLALAARLRPTDADTLKPKCQRAKATEATQSRFI